MVLHRTVDSDRSQPRAGAANSGPIKVVVVEDEPAFLQRFCDAITAAPGLSLSGSARTVAEAREVVDRTRPDVVLVDLGLPDGRGNDVIRHARAGNAACDVIVVTIFGDDGHVIDSLSSGATGYLLKDALPGDIASAIRQVHDGGAPISPAIARRVLQRFHVPASGAGTGPDAAIQPSRLLSERETQILRLVAKGLSFKEVGSALGISAHTVISHVKHTYQKLEVHSRGEAVYEANQLGLL